MDAAPSPTLEALFIAGVMGAIAAMVLRQNLRVGVPLSFWARLWYLAVAGYVAAFILAQTRLYEAFVAGVCLDILLTCFRRISSKRDLQEPLDLREADSHE